MKLKGLRIVVLCTFLILLLTFASGEFQKTIQTVVSNPAGKGFPAVSYSPQAERLSRCLAGAFRRGP